MITGMSRVLKYTGLKPKNIHKEGLIIANQTELLDVSDEMKVNDGGQNLCEERSAEEFYRVKPRIKRGSVF